MGEVIPSFPNFSKGSGAQEIAGASSAGPFLGVSDLFFFFVGLMCLELPDSLLIQGFLNFFKVWVSNYIDIIPWFHDFVKDISMIIMIGDYLRDNDG